MPGLGVLSLLLFLGVDSVKDQMAVGTWLYFWVLYYVPLVYLSIFMCHAVLVTVALQCSLKFDNVKPLALFFLFRMTLSIHAFIFGSILILE